MREGLALGASRYRIKWMFLQAVTDVWRRLISWFSAAGEKKAEIKETPVRTSVYMQAEDIIDRYGDMLFRYAYSYLHNLSDAEEILQDTLIQFMKSAPTFTSESHRKAWLLRVAGNLSKNRISYNAIRQTDELKEELVLFGGFGIWHLVSVGKKPVAEQDVNGMEEVASIETLEKYVGFSVEEIHVLPFETENTYYGILILISLRNYRSNYRNKGLR